MNKQECWPRGLWRSLAKRVWLKLTEVRILHVPVITIFVFFIINSSVCFSTTISKYSLIDYITYQENLSLKEQQEKKLAISKYFDKKRELSFTEKIQKGILKEFNKKKHKVELKLNTDSNFSENNMNILYELKKNLLLKKKRIFFLYDLYTSCLNSEYFYKNFYINIISGNIKLNLGSSHYKKGYNEIGVFLEYYSLEKEWNKYTNFIYTKFYLSKYKWPCDLLFYHRFKEEKYSSKNSKDELFKLNQKDILSKVHIKFNEKKIAKYFKISEFINIENRINMWKDKVVNKERCNIIFNSNIGLSGLINKSFDILISIGYISFIKARMVNLEETLLFPIYNRYSYNISDSLNIMCFSSIYMQVEKYQVKYNFDKVMITCIYRTTLYSKLIFGAGIISSKTINSNLRMNINMTFNGRINEHVEIEFDHNLLIRYNQGKLDKVFFNKLLFSYIF